MGTYNREKLLLKAWVRYDGNGELVPGSIVYRKRKPAGKFKELVDPPQDPCCLISTTTAPPSCAESGFWTDEFTQIGPVQSEDTPLPFYMQTTKEGCSPFFFLQDESNNGIVYPSGQQARGAMIIKANGDGSHVWSKAGQFFTGNQTQTAGRKIAQDAEGNTYVLYNTGTTDTGYVPLGIAKLNPSGAVIWAKLFNGTYPENYGYFYIDAIKVHENGYVYVAGGVYGVGEEYQTYGAPLLLKINPSNGNIEASKAYYSTLPASTPGLEQYGLSQFDFTPEGDIVLSIGMYIFQEPPDQPEYKDYYPLCVIKVDQGLNLIWANYGENIPGRCADPSCSGGYADLELMSVQVDRFGYIYGNGWGQDIIKLNPDGTLNFHFILTLPYYTTPFQYAFNNDLTIVDKTQNNLWLIASNVTKSWYTGNPADSDTAVIVTNLDLYGNIRWSTAIQATGYPNNAVFATGNWDTAIAEDGILYFNCTSYNYNVNPVEYIYTQLKVPSTQVTGTIGSYEFTDITSAVGKYYPNDLKISFQNMVTQEITLPEWPLEYTYEVVDITTTDTLNTITV